MAININRQIELLLPVVLRNSGVQALLRVLLSPLTEIYSRFTAAADDAALRACVNGSTISLRYYLEYRFKTRVAVREDDGLPYDFRVLMNETSTADFARIRDFVNHYKVAGKSCRMENTPYRIEFTSHACERKEYRAVFSNHACEQRAYHAAFVGYACTRIPVAYISAQVTELSSSGPVVTVKTTDGTAVMSRVDVTGRVYYGDGNELPFYIPILNGAAQAQGTLTWLPGSGTFDYRVVITNISPLMDAYLAYVVAEDSLLTPEPEPTPTPSEE
jgi:hypothetical protein